MLAHNERSSLMISNSYLLSRMIGYGYQTTNVVGWWKSQPRLSDVPDNEADQSSSTALECDLYLVIVVVVVICVLEQRNDVKWPIR